MEAPKPRNELLRIQSVGIVKSRWESSIRSDARYVKKIKNAFADQGKKLSGVTISLMEKGVHVVMNEIGQGITLSRVPCQCSLDTHAILSVDHSILDTKKDWRVSTNPLVIGYPYMMQR